MKKIISILLVMLVALSALPLVLADDNTTVDDTTDNDLEDEDEEETEAEIMGTQYGAEVRLLQLEKAITLNIERGREVIAEAEDPTELEAILAELEALLTEVQNADPAAEDAVQTFVDLKKDARDLCKQFRDAAKPLIPEEKQEQLREKIRKMEHKELKEKIKAKIRAFNSHKMQNFYGVLGLEEDIVEKIINGEITAKEAKEQMKEKLKSMTKEERKEAYQQLKEQRIAAEVAAKAKVAKAKENFLERQQNRIKERLEKAGVNTEKLQERLEAFKENQGAKGNGGGKQ
ncbi:MAG: hypothetical protein ABIH53_00665 [archaeon]